VCYCCSTTVHYWGLTSHLWLLTFNNPAPRAALTIRRRIDERALYRESKLA
jgi:hypothetical protein